MSWRARWEVPDDVAGRWIELHGHEVVDAWLADVKALAARCAKAWSLNIEGFLPGGSLSCVLACRRADGTAVVLKLLAPWAHEAIRTEVLALSAWNGRGAVLLLEHTPDGRALLLHRVSPGCAFSPSGNDEADCRRAAETLGVLASAAAPAELPALSAVVRARFARARGVGCQRDGWVTRQELDAAEGLAVELAQTATCRGLVHGDAQDKNLLIDESSLLVAIDPEPGAGDRHFDPALWALTHRPGQGVRERCSMLADLLNLDAARLWSWCLVLIRAEVALEEADRAQAHHDLLARFALPGGG
jgi:streptomycin 6-kinase